MNKNLLIVFTKNPELGKVKRRLAKDIGDEKALAIYYKLLNNTKNATEGVDADVAVFYNQFVDTEDEWSNSKHQKFKQAGSDIGERMFNAMAKGKELGYQKVCLIGADILNISSEIINRAFGRLDYHNWVFGPAKDGGYYLVGSTKPEKEVFNLERWSHTNVLKDTLLLCDKLNLSVSLVDELNDIDTIEDLKGTELEKLMY